MWTGGDRGDASTNKKGRPLISPLPEKFQRNMMFMALWRRCMRTEAVPRSVGKTKKISFGVQQARHGVVQKTSLNASVRRDACPPAARRVFREGAATNNNGRLTCTCPGNAGHRIRTPRKEAHPWKFMCSRRCRCTRCLEIMFRSFWTPPKSLFARSLAQGHSKGAPRSQLKRPGLQHLLEQEHE